jgi:CRP-like cAMP-binding protein
VSLEVCVIRGSVVASGHVLRSLRLLLEAYAASELPEWEAFARTLHSSHIDAGDVLFSAGEAHPYVYYVEEGLLKAQMTNARGRPIITFFSEEGEILASTSALATEGVRQVASRSLHPRVGELRAAIDGVAIHTLIAIEPSLVHRFDFRVVERLAARHSAWSRMIQSVSLMYAITLQADAGALRNSPEQRYRDLLARHPDLVARISRRDLASYLNVTDVALSRIAKRVQADPDADEDE